MDIDNDQIANSLPHYLTAEDKAVLLKELDAISRGGAARYYLNQYSDQFEDEMLQGDGWQGFDVFQMESGKRLTVGGIVLSNSCDIDPNNKRERSPRVIFAPIEKLGAAASILKQKGLPSDRIETQLSAIRSQRNTSCFYLPKNEILNEECMVRLDNVHSIPYSLHLKNSGRKKLFTLSNTGFYMLVFKLSVHFCRLQENVRRGSG
jgi:hypothetical protein